MWKQNLFSLVLATLASVSWAAPGDVCRSSLGSGTCKSTGSCTTGFTVRGACPNDPADIRCCIQTACKTNTGTCLDKSITPCRGGRFEAGHCPGSTNIQCCIRDTAPTPAPTPKCPTYWVIGVRGSGESLAGANEIEKMRATVSAYVREAAAALPADTEYLSLPYAAAPVGPDYLTSQQAGAELLRTVIRARVSACPNIRIGVVGYSQGAHVVNDALNYLGRNAPSALERVRGVLQIADPRADPSKSYQLGITLNGSPAPVKQSGGVLVPQALPAAVAGRATSVCISGDIVCDAPKKGLALLVSAVTVGFHQAYKTCCTQFLFTRILGGALANRLKA